MDLISRFEIKIQSNPVKSRFQDPNFHIQSNLTSDSASWENCCHRSQSYLGQRKLGELLTSDSASWEHWFWSLDLKSRSSQIQSNLDFQIQISISNQILPQTALAGRTAATDPWPPNICHLYVDSWGPALGASSLPAWPASGCTHAIPQEWFLFSYLICVGLARPIWIRCVFGILWCVRGVYTVCIRCAYGAYTVCIRCVNGVHTVCVRCVHSVCTVCTRYVYGVYTVCTGFYGVYTACIRNFRQGNQQIHGRIWCI